MGIREQIKEYNPYNEQEIKDKEMILKYIDTFADVFTRDKVLMIYHNLYSSWPWSGGHADGEEHMKPIYTKIVDKAKKLD